MTLSEEYVLQWLIAAEILISIDSSSFKHHLFSFAYEKTTFSQLLHASHQLILLGLYEAAGFLLLLAFLHGRVKLVHNFDELTTLEETLQGQVREDFYFLRFEVRVAERARLMMSEN
jgi:hypothetical protein